jgi:hypothetical protein
LGADKRGKEQVMNNVVGAALPGSGNWQSTLNAFRSEEFLQSTPEGGAFIRLPSDLRARLLAAGVEESEVDQYIGTFTAWAEWANDILSSGDLTDAEKGSFLARYFSFGDGDLEADNDPANVGRLLAIMVSGDPAALKDVFDWGEEFDVEDLQELEMTRTEDFGKWRNEHDIQRPKDTKAVKDMNSYFGDLKRSMAEYEDMTIRELAEKRRKRKV